MDLPISLQEGILRIRMSPREDLTNNLMRVAKRDPEAFDALYQATSAKLFGIVIRILHRRELAEEVLQDVYLKIWERAGDFNPAKGSPITWMAILARNRALDCVRRHAAMALDDVVNIDELHNCKSEGHMDVGFSDDLRRLMDCLNGLPQDKRDMVLLAYHQGYSREDLSRRYNSPVNTIKTWLHRSLAQLRDCLGS